MICYVLSIQVPATISFAGAIDTLDSAATQVSVLAPITGDYTGIDHACSQLTGLCLVGVALC